MDKEDTFAFLILTALFLCGLCFLVSGILTVVMQVRGKNTPVIVFGSLSVGASLFELLLVFICKRILREGSGFPSFVIDQLLKMGIGYYLSILTSFAVLILSIVSKCQSNRGTLGCA